MAQQSAILLQVYILPERVGDLEKLLNTGGNPTIPSSFFPIEKIKSVHFARWIIAPATAEFKASLIYSANVDGSVAEHLHEIINVLPKAIDLILEHCEGYPLEQERTNASRLSFLKSISKKTAAFYVGAPNRTVEQIQNEKKMQTELRLYVKESGKKWKSSREAYNAIKAYAVKNEAWNSVRKGIQLPKRRPVKMILFVLLILLISPLLILAILSVYFFYERREKPFGKPFNKIPIDRIKALKSKEDIIYQNQLSQVFETKGGLRKLMLKLLLYATNFAAKNWFVNGELMGTPTIHFARWAFIDGGKRFVFFSNFDGSFDGYLGDFVDNNGWGLNAIYGAAKGYPTTFFMFGKGTYNLQEFMGWGRLTQVQSQIWYSAYPWSGLQQIISRSELSASLFSDKQLSDEEMKRTLRNI